MGKNKFENFVFSIMVCALMVTGMTIYNLVLQSHSGNAIAHHLLSLSFVGIFAVAFVIDWFIAAPIVKSLVKKWTNDQTPFIKKVLMISGLMVLFMCSAMSLVATLFQGFEGDLLPAYLHTFAINIIFALPLQFLLVGPVARLIFLKLFQPQPLAAAS